MNVTAKARRLSSATECLQIYAILLKNDMGQCSVCAGYQPTMQSNAPTNTSYNILPSGINYMNNYLAPTMKEMAAEMRMVEATRMPQSPAPPPAAAGPFKYPGDNNRYS